VTTTNKAKGVYAPVVTPFLKNLEPDTAELIRQCEWLLTQNVGLAIFGTNSEANSLSVREKIDLMDALVAAGIAPDRMLPGTGCCALSDTVELTRHAVRLGTIGVLMLPPFFYKGVSDDGIFASYAETIERVGDAGLRIYLYHIPQVSQVPISLAVIERLLKAYPTTIAGIKDSSGDWENTRALIETFGPQGFDVFCGSERFLLATLRAGGVGSITATANVHPGPIAQLYRTWERPGADERQGVLDAVRSAFEQFPMIPALKATIAHHAQKRDWRIVRPPLTALDHENAQALSAALAKLEFSMPGL